MFKTDNKPINLSVITDYSNFIELKEGENYKYGDFVCINQEANIFAELTASFLPKIKELKVTQLKVLRRKS